MSINLRTSKDPLSSGPTGRAQQGTLPETRQTGPLVNNKPVDTLAPQIIFPANSDNRITHVLPTQSGGPHPATSGEIWPRIDYSENLQTSAPAAAFTVNQFNAFAASYIAFAVPHILKNRKIYAYINVIFPNVGAFGAIVANINLFRKGKLLTSFPLSLYNNANNNVAAGTSVPFVCGSGLAGYDSLGLSLKNLQAGEASPVSLIPLICAIDIDRITVDLDPNNSTPLNISSLRIWVGCISY